MAMGQLLEQLPERLIEILNIQIVMRLSKRIGSQDIAGQSLERLQDIKRLSILLELLQPANKLLDVILEHIVKPSDISFREKLRNSSPS